MATVRANPEIVRSLRIQQGMEQAALATKAGLSERTIQNVEAGRPVQLYSVVAAAKALGVEHRILIEEETVTLGDIEAALIGKAVEGSEHEDPPVPRPEKSVVLMLELDHKSITPEFRMGLLVMIGQILERGGTLRLGKDG
jgi:transcriptional regulator with XRE-family HTH domain